MVCWFEKLRNKTQYNLKDVVRFGCFICLLGSVAFRRAFVTNICMVGMPALIPQLPCNVAAHCLVTMIIFVMDVKTFQLLPLVTVATKASNFYWVLCLRAISVPPCGLFLSCFLVT